MPTVDEEIQAKEFLKRAEIRTMKKDLQALREVDALKERDKIIQLKTLEEQLAEKKRAEEAAAAAAAAAEKEEKMRLEKVLEKNQGREKIAEKDLKNYASEEERQQIFLLEFQRLDFEKQVDAIDKERGPVLKLEKNKLLIKKRDQQEKLTALVQQERKLEAEQKFISEKEQTSTSPLEKRTLEQSRAELDKKIQDIEKTRWALEKQIEDIDEEITKVDKASDKLVTEKNLLRDRILGVDKSLRDLYLAVMAREEEKRSGRAQEQAARKEALAQVRAEEKEKIQRQQWTGSQSPAQSFPKPSTTKSIPQIPIPVPVKRIPKMYDIRAEEEQRKKFMQNVEQGATTSPQQKSNIQ